MARHLFVYLALVAAVVVVLSAVLARSSLAMGLSDFDGRVVPGVIFLSLTNYFLRFLKWERLLADVGVWLPRRANLRLYFACFAMVVTPARLGELYKLVFLRHLHGIPAARALPALVFERAGDAVALLLLAPAAVLAPLPALAVTAGGVFLVVAIGAGLTHPGMRRRLRSLARWAPRGLRRRLDLSTLVEGHVALLRPRSWIPNLGLSLLAWAAEGVGLAWILRGLGQTTDLFEATGVYALSTALGNLTFLPGGLGGTEVSLVGLLGRHGVAFAVAVTAAALVRAATLWFAVVLGLGVTLAARDRLRWNEMTEKALERERSPAAG